MDDISWIILKLIIAVCAFIITSFVIPYLEAIVQNEKYKTLLNMVNTAVKSAEQTIKGEGVGVAKKQKVMESLSKWLSKYKIRVDAEELSDLVECAVYGMKAAKGE